MVHIQSSTCRAWTKHFANLSANLVQTNAGINHWWWRKGISFGVSNFWAKIQQVDWKCFCFKLFITCRLGMMMMVKEDGLEHVHTLYSAGWWGHSKARLVGHGAMQWQARTNMWFAGDRHRELFVNYWKRSFCKVGIARDRNMKDDKVCSIFVADGGGGIYLLFWLEGTWP